MGCSTENAIMISNNTKLYFRDESEKYKIIFIIKNPCSSEESSIYKKLSEYFIYNYLSTGDIINELYLEKRTDNENYNDIKNGKLMASDEVVEILKNEILKMKDCKNLLIEGFPRNLDNLNQWKNIMSGITSLKKILYIKITKEEMQKRIDEKNKIENFKNYQKYVNQINNFNNEITALIEKCKNDNILIEVDGMQKKKEEIYQNFFRKFIKNKLF